MKYTKKQLIGSIFKLGDTSMDWYKIIPLNDDVTIQRVSNSETNIGWNDTYTVGYINRNWLSYLDLSTLNNKKVIQIY